MVVPIGIGVKVCARLSGVAINVVRWLSTEVLLAVRSTIPGAPHGRLSASFFGHLHLGLVALVVLGAYGWQEVDKKAENIPRVDEGNDPLEYRGDVPTVILLRDAKDDAEADFWETPVSRSRGVCVCLDHLPAMMKASLIQKEIRRIECSR